MSRKLDPDSINFLLVDLARLIRGEFEVRINAAGLGVSSGEARVLAHIARMEPVRQALLAEALSMTQVSLTEFLDRLEDAGFVERRADREDRRAKQVRLTKKSLPLLDRIAAIGAGVRASMETSPDLRETELIRNDLKIMRENLLSLRQKRNRDGG